MPYYHSMYKYWRHQATSDRKFLITAPLTISWLGPKWLSEPAWGWGWLAPYSMWVKRLHTLFPKHLIATWGHPSTPSVPGESLSCVLQNISSPSRQVEEAIPGLVSTLRHLASQGETSLPSPSLPSHFHFTSQSLPHHRTESACLTPWA